MTRHPSNLVNYAGGAILLAILAAAFWYLASQARTVPPLERSAIGFDGLVQLLNEQERPARTFSGGSQLDTEFIGLRILPLYQGNSGYWPPNFARAGEQIYMMPPDHPIVDWVIARKVETAPTLVVLPKWSDGVRRSGLAHPEFLLRNPDTEGAADAVSIQLPPSDAQAGDELNDGEVDATPSDDQDMKEGVSDQWQDTEGITLLDLPMPELASTDTARDEMLFTTRIGNITLRARQYVRAPKGCTALVGDQEQALLLECRREEGGTLYWILSDPDLLNNHGLHLGRNVDAALRMVDRISSGDEVVVDYSTWVWSTPDDDRRTLEELLRYFAPPFAWIWLAAALLFLLAWWRGAIRDRPIFSRFGHGHSGTRYTVVAAQSRLMRNTGRDGALLRVLANQRVLSLCDLLLGRDDRVSDRKARMLAFVERRNPDLAKRLKEALHETETAPERLAPGAAVALLTRLEAAYEEARELA